MIKTTAIFVGEIILVLAVAAAVIYCVIGMLNCCKRCCNKKRKYKEKKEDITSKYNTTEKGRAFNDIIDYWDKKDYAEKPKKAKEFFDGFLSKDVVTKLYILDPRVNIIRCYADLNDEEINKITSEFSNCYVYEIKKHRIYYKKIVQHGGRERTGFSFNVVSEKDKDKLIEIEYEEYLIDHEEARKTIF